MKIRLELEITETEFKQLRTYSLERVLTSLNRARSRGEVLSVQHDASIIQKLASRLWYAASGATPEFDDEDE